MALRIHFIEKVIQKAKYLKFIPNNHPTIIELTKLLEKAANSTSSALSKVSQELEFKIWKIYFSLKKQPSEKINKAFKTAIDEHIWVYDNESYVCLDFIKTLEILYDKQPTLFNNFKNYELLCRIFSDQISGEQLIAIINCLAEIDHLDQEAFDFFISASEEKITRSYAFLKSLKEEIGYLEKSIIQIALKNPLMNKYKIHIVHLLQQAHLCNEQRCSIINSSTIGKANYPKVLSLFIKNEWLEEHEIDNALHELTLYDLSEIIDFLQCNKLLSKPILKGVLALARELNDGAATPMLNLYKQVNMLSEQLVESLFCRPQQNEFLSELSIKIDYFFRLDLFLRNYTHASDLLSLYQQLEIKPLGILDLSQDNLKEISRELAHLDEKLGEWYMSRRLKDLAIDEYKMRSLAENAISMLHRRKPWEEWLEQNLETCDIKTSELTRSENPVPTRGPKK